LGLFPADARTQQPDSDQGFSVEILDGLPIPAQRGPDLRKVLGPKGKKLGDVAEAEGEGRGFMRGALGASAGGLPALPAEDDQGTAEDEFGGGLFGLRHGDSFPFFL
jgi:hypothetical protein